MVNSEAEKEDFFDAIYHGNCDKVELLLGQGMNANVTNRSNEPALLYAALHGQDGCVETLLAYGANTQKLPMTAAAVPDNPAVMQRFLAMGGDPNGTDEWGQTPLMEAANWGNIETIRLLLRHGADAQQQAQNGARALDAARQYGHTDVIALLTQA